MSEPTHQLRVCICADPENCREVPDGYICRRSWFTPKVEPAPVIPDHICGICYHQFDRCSHCDPPTPAAHPPAVGRLRVEIWLGPCHHHVIEGPMGFHVEGIGAILRAVHAQLDENDRISHVLNRPAAPAEEHHKK